MNPHMPLVTCAMQSNTDACVVATLGQSQKYLCKYCSKHGKRMGQNSVLFDVLEDMKDRDDRSWQKDPETFEATKLGSKMHKAFMAEVGEEMCQAELAHHANQSPEYLISRPVKDVYLYKKAKAITLKSPITKPDETAWEEDHQYWDEPVGPPLDDEDEGHGQEQEAPDGKQRKRGVVKPSDVDLYEKRCSYYFADWEYCSSKLPHVAGSCEFQEECHCVTAVAWNHDIVSDEQLETGDLLDGGNLVASTADAQLLNMSVFQFFWLVKFVGGSYPRFQWQDINNLPVVLMSPNVKLMEGPEFSFGARWCLMQQHPWVDRRFFLDRNEEEIIAYFREWIKSDGYPWHVVDDYLKANGVRSRLGAGSFKEKKTRRPLRNTLTFQARRHQSRLQGSSNQLETTSKKRKQRIRNSARICACSEL